ncbi:MAG: hypothetical protein ACR2HR_09780 [Euzebya sp.]
MSTIELLDETAARLEAEAARRGVSVQQLIITIAAELAGRDQGQRTQPARRLGFVNLGRSQSGRRARDADEMLVEGFGQR